MLKYFIYYLIAINLIASIVNISDKWRAIHNKRRIPEKTLWIFGMLGGALGSYFTMEIIRHKTKHKSFMIGMPLLALVYIVVLFGLCYIA